MTVAFCKSLNSCEAFWAVRAGTACGLAARARAAALIGSSNLTTSVRGVSNVRFVSNVLAALSRLLRYLLCHALPRNNLRAVAAIEECSYLVVSILAGIHGEITT